MSLTVAPFTMDHYVAVRALWEESEGVGLHEDSDSPAGVQDYLERNPA